MCQFALCRLAKLTSEEMGGYSFPIPLFQVPSDECGQITLGHLGSAIGEGGSGIATTRSAGSALNRFWIRCGQGELGAGPELRPDIDDFKKASPDEVPPPARHPVLFPHPLTQQLALYLPDSSTGTQKANRDYSGEVRALGDRIRQRVSALEHVWAVGDLLIVDNLQAMHRPIGGYGDYPRLLYRCQVRCRALR